MQKHMLVRALVIGVILFASILFLNWIWVFHATDHLTFLEPASIFLDPTTNFLRNSGLFTGSGITLGPKVIILKQLGVSSAIINAFSIGITVLFLVAAAAFSALAIPILFITAFFFFIYEAEYVAAALMPVCAFLVPIVLLVCCFIAPIGLFFELGFFQVATGGYRLIFALLSIPMVFGAAAAGVTGSRSGWAVLAEGDSFIFLGRK